jgi:molybdate/tungstate transport system substrate-binding protein
MGKWNQGYRCVGRSSLGRLNNLAALVLILLVTMLPACDRPDDEMDAKHGGGKIEGDLIIFHAGSLSHPFRDVAKLFEERYPAVKVKAEAAGSRDCARKISDLGRLCDVMGSADFKVVENLLMPDHTDFNVRFATNEMAIAYTGHSRGRERIDADTWPDLLLEDDIAFGRADPNRDPCGYRSVMVFQLAEIFFGEAGLAAKLTEKDGSKYIRPKETDLLALLEMGEIDYLFIYRSVAEQHGLDYLLLPDEVNLKSQGLGELYSRATIQVTGRNPGEMITRQGAPMVYSVTIPRNAPNHPTAEAFMELLLSPEGRAIMEKNGQPALTPAPCREFDKLPVALQKHCSQG